jgi:hypothetical protein
LDTLRDNLSPLFVGPFNDICAPGWPKADDALTAKSRSLTHLSFFGSEVPTHPR